MVDVTALQNEIKESGMTIVSICDKSGILKQTFYNRLKKPDDFTVDEVLNLSQTLRLTKPRMMKIFFS